MERRAEGGRREAGSGKREGKKRKIHRRGAEGAEKGVKREAGRKGAGARADVMDGHKVIRYGDGGEGIGEPPPPAPPAAGRGAERMAEPFRSPFCILRLLASVIRLIVFIWNNSGYSQENVWPVGIVEQDNGRSDDGGV